MVLDAKNLFQSVIFSSLIVSQIAYVQAAPQVVFRSTLTPPSEVFKDGFKSPGSNDNLPEHVNGGSCKKGTTAFVATSSDHNFIIRRWAADGLWMEPPSVYPEVYMYSIRATDNIYSVYDSLISTGERQDRNLAERFRHQSEWVAHGGIQASQIQSATVYRRGRTPGELQFVRVIPNPNYEHGQTEANSAPYPVAQQQGASNLSLTPTLGLTPIAACFLSCLSPNYSRFAATLNAVRNNQCLETSFSVNSNQKVKAISPLTKKEVTIYGPWREEVKNLPYAVSTRVKPNFCDTIDAGESASADQLVVSCDTRNIKRFYIKLRAGGRAHHWVEYLIAVNATGNKTTKIIRSKDIPVLKTKYTLADYGYSISDVFSSGGGGWWSTISVTPEYPYVYLHSNTIAR